MKRALMACGDRLLLATRGDALDRALIDGADPAGSRTLTRRAAHLTSMRDRSHLAEGIERLALSASAPTRAIVGGDAHALSANRDRLAELAELLRRDVPVYARGVALLRSLLSDPGSPAHAGDAAALSEALDAARGAMTGRIARPPADATAGAGVHRAWEGRAGGSYLLGTGGWVHPRRESS